MAQAHDHLQHGQRRGHADGQLQIGCDDEQCHEHDARQYRFDNASRTADGVDHGKIVSITGVGKRTKTGSFFRFGFSHTY